MIQIPDSVLQQKPLAEGGEGIIFECKGMILKVYKNFINKAEKLKKIERLINKQLSPSIIPPIEVAYNTKGQFIGYLMKKVTGEEFKMLSNKKYVKVNNINIEHISSMLTKIKDIIKELHSKNIYISDLNEKNFLFDKQFNVYAIDVDSWTVEDIKCEVCMEAYQYIINDKRKIINWGIHYDKVSKQWLFITEDAKGKFDTYVFEVSRQGLTKVYHNDIIKYTNNLGYMCFSNKLIFKAGDGFIKGYSYEKNAHKDFPCEIVTEDTKLIRDGVKFVAITEKGIYKIG